MKDTSNGISRERVESTRWGRVLATSTRMIALLPHKLQAQEIWKHQLLQSRGHEITITKSNCRNMSTASQLRSWGKSTRGRCRRWHLDPENYGTVKIRGWRLEGHLTLPDLTHHNLEWILKVWINPWFKEASLVKTLGIVNKLWLNHFKDLFRLLVVRILRRGRDTLCIQKQNWCQGYSLAKIAFNRRSTKQSNRNLWWIRVWSLGLVRLLEIGFPQFKMQRQ